MKKILIIILILLSKIVLAQPIKNKYLKDWNEICRGEFKMHGMSDYLRKDTSLKGLVFTLIVGYGVEEEIRINQECAYILMQRGATVYQIYGNQNYQKFILNILQKSDVIIYSGHGGFIPEDNYMSFICLKKDDGNTMKFDNKTFKDFKFKEGSIFIFRHSCFAAGESASDTVEITKEESIYRSSIRAKFLLDRGIFKYFATNGGAACGGFEPILNSGMENMENYIRKHKMWENGILINTYQEIKKDSIRGLWNYDSVYWVK